MRGWGASPRAVVAKCAKPIASGRGSGVALPAPPRRNHAMTSQQPPQLPKRFTEGEFATGGREIALIVAILARVAVGMVATYWSRSRAEASSKPGVTTEAPAATPATPEASTRARVLAPAPTAPDTDVVHTDIYFDFKSTRL